MQNLRNSTYQLLRRSEAFFKTDMVYLTKGNFWLISSQAVGSIFSLVLAVAFANLITPEEYGNYKYVFSLAGMISAFSLSGLNVAVLRAAANGFEGTLKYAFKLSLTWSVGMFILSLLGGTYYLLRGNDFLGFSLLTIGAASPIISAASLYRSYLSGKGEFKKLGLYAIAQSTLPTVFVLSGLLLKAPLLLLVGAHFLITMGTILFLYMSTVRLIQNENVDPQTNRLGKHLSIMGVVSTIAGRLDSVLVFQLLGGAELAVFSLAVTIPDMIRSYFKNITSLAMPKFANKTKEEMKSAVWSKVGIVALIAGIIAVLYMIAAPYIFEIFFPRYLAAVPFSQVYVISIVMSLLLASAYFDSQAAVRERYIINIIINTTAIATTVLGIYFFGIWGAILARIFTRVVNVSLAAFLIERH